MATGERGKSIMKKKRHDPDMPIGKLRKVDDFLPPPHVLIIPTETIKITISLSRSSVDFYKDQSRQLGTKYQRMIREVVDKYAERYSK